MKSLRKKSCGTPRRVIVTSPPDSTPCATTSRYSPLAYSSCSVCLMFSAVKTSPALRASVARKSPTSSAETPSKRTSRTRNPYQLFRSRYRNTAGEKIAEDGEESTVEEDTWVADLV